MKSRGGVFFLQLVYLAGLGVLAGLFLNGDWIHRDSLGTVPIAVPWWGALGGVVLSLSGIFQHADDWDENYAFWHWTRPIVGLILGSFTVLVFQAGVLAVGQDLKPAAGVSNAQDLFYYVAAFIVGYREATARTLIQRVADVVIGPGEATTTSGTTTSGSPMIADIAPSVAAPGDLVMVTGAGLENVQSVTFETYAAQFTVASDTQLAVVTPQGPASGTVSVVTLTLQDGKQLRGQLTYR
jgi:hypothetical protein